LTLTNNNFHLDTQPATNKNITASGAGHCRISSSNSILLLFHRDVTLLSILFLLQQLIINFASVSTDTALLSRLQ
jgi:hypothetical protein